MEEELKSRDVIARKFGIGQMLDIEVTLPTRARFQGPLIGVKEGRYLITELPSLNRYGNLRDKLLNDQELIIRTICEKTSGECLGFKTYICGKLRMPDNLLFLTFPQEVQVHELRYEKRLLVTQTAHLVVGKTELVIQGMLTDLSGGGCRFECKENPDVEFKKDDRVQIQFVHPETGLNIDSGCRICSIKNYQNFISLGMAFDK